MPYCENCGCKEYNGACVNCHEAVYIEEQYHDLNMAVPDRIRKESDEAQADIQRKRMIKNSF